MPRAVLLTLTLLVAPAAAGAAAKDPKPTPAPAPAPPPGQPPAPPAPRASLGLQSVQRVGSQRLVFVGARFVVTGTLAPMPAPPKAVVAVRRGRKTIRRVRVDVAPDPTGQAGKFSVKLRATRAGSYSLRLAGARTLKLAVIRPRARSGSRGLAVSFLQSRLRALHYAVPRSGRFDGGTGRAVLAYRKVSRLKRNQSASKRIFGRLAAGKGTFKVRYGGQGRHVEADLSRQVLALINAGGKVFRIYHMSSGKPSTPTVLGTFSFYAKTYGTNGQGMVDPTYFVGGYAIHGYRDVPAYPASHGCVRLPIPNAAFVQRQLRTGERIDVYR